MKKLLLCVMAAAVCLTLAVMLGGCEKPQPPESQPEPVGSMPQPSYRNDFRLMEMALNSDEEFVKYALARGLTLPELESLGAMGYTVAEFFDTSIEEINFIFYRSDAVQRELERVGEHGEIELDFANIGFFDGTDSQIVTAGHEYGGLLVKDAQTKGYWPCSSLPQAVTYQRVEFEGDIALKGMVVREGEELVFFLHNQSVGRLPGMTWLGGSNTLHLTNAQEAAGILEAAGVPYGRICEIRVNEYAFTFSQKVEYAQERGEPVEYPETQEYVKRARLDAVTSFEDGADYDEILRVVREILGQYRDGTVDTSPVQNSEQRYVPVPQGLVLPEEVSLEDLTVSDDTYMEGYHVSLPSVDGSWTIGVWVTNFTYNQADGSSFNPGHIAYAVGFMEKAPQ